MALTSNISESDLGNFVFECEAKRLPTCVDGAFRNKETIDLAKLLD